MQGPGETSWTTLPYTPPLSLNPDSTAQPPLSPWVRVAHRRLVCLPLPPPVRDMGDGRFPDLGAGQIRYRGLRTLGSETR